MKEYIPENFKCPLCDVEFVYFSSYRKLKEYRYPIQNAVLFVGTKAPKETSYFYHEKQMYYCKHGQPECGNI